jgi:hypothetical protein
LYSINSERGYGEIKLNNGNKIVPYKSKLVYFDKDKNEIEMTGGPNSQLISRELGSKQFGDLKDSSGTKLYDALIKKGSDDKIW